MAFLSSIFRKRREDPPDLTTRMYDDLKEARAESAHAREEAFSALRTILSDQKTASAKGHEELSLRYREVLAALLQQNAGLIAGFAALSGRVTEFELNKPTLALEVELGAKQKQIEELEEMLAQTQDEKNVEGARGDRLGRDVEAILKSFDGKPGGSQMETDL